MELVYHTFGVGETLGLEGKIAVVTLPVVVYHQHSCREAVIDDGMRIAKDILLVLVVHQFNPGVVLRTREEERVRQQTGRRESGRRSRLLCLAQGRTRFDFLQRNRRTYLTVYGRENERLVAPHVFSLRREEERHELVVGILREEIESGLVLIWLVMPQPYCRTPPSGLGVADKGKQQKQYSGIAAHITYFTVTVVRRL